MVYGHRGNGDDYEQDVAEKLGTAVLHTVGRLFRAGYLISGEWRTFAALRFMCGQRRYCLRVKLMARWQIRANGACRWPLTPEIMDSIVVSASCTSEIVKSPAI